MIILVDSREQRPLPFRVEGMIEEVRRVALSFGDYSCLYRDGSTALLYFERKSIPDLFGTMGKGYVRFKKEIQRANKSHIQLVLLVEGTLSQVYAGIPQSEIKGESVVKKLFMLWVKYDLYPMFCATRGEMVEFVRETYEAIGRLEWDSQGEWR